MILMFVCAGIHPRRMSAEAVVERISATNVFSGTW